MLPAQHIRHESELGSWEAALRHPHPALAPYVQRYAVYSERICGFTRRREPPSGIVPILIALDRPIRVAAPLDPGRVPRPYDAFVAGAHSSFAITESGDAQSGVQVNFTLLGARMFLGMPMHELTNRVFEVEDVLGVEGRILVECLRAAPTWDHCFDILEDTIVERLSRASAMPEDIAWAIQQVASPGRPPIGYIAEQLGHSHRHFISRFRREVGLTPATLSRVFRFERALEVLHSGDSPCWTEIALECGYYDQAHLSRDFRDFIGYSPGEYWRNTVADNGGVVDR
jgi:AraC-like DNA-binding protein